MKKRLSLISLVLVLTLLILPVSSAFAWDVEDTEVAANEDFITGVGWDGSTSEQHNGEQSWPYSETPSDSYNLYRDDATGTGNLDKIWSLVTRTPNIIDLPGATIDYYPSWDNVYYMTSDESPDTWYWAIEPRGYDNPSPIPSGESPWSGAATDFQVVVATWDSFESYQWKGGYVEDGHVLKGEISQEGKANGCHLKLVIPAGTVINEGLGRASTLLIKCIGGALIFEASPSHMTFSEPAVLYEFVDGEWVELITFTEIRGGEASQPTTGAAMSPFI